MQRYLVVANETVGGDELVTEVSNRAGDDVAFHVIVPSLVDTGAPSGGGNVAAIGGGPTSTTSFADPDTGRDDETPSGTTDARAGGVASGGAVHAERQTWELLKRVTDRLERVAHDVSGDVGAGDAVTAVREATEAVRYDGVILATPAPAGSQLVGQDLGERLERAVDVPVTTVYAPRSHPGEAE